MAVAKDAATGGQADGTTTVNWSHTCTGSELVLYVAFSCSSGVGTPTVTYNGVSMTKDASAPFNGATSTLYYLINPATGANTVLISSVTAGDIQGCSFSVTGGKQTGIPYTLTTSSAGSGTHTGTTTLTEFGIAFESSGSSISTPNKTAGNIQNNNAGSAVSNYACQSTAAGGSQTFTWADNADQYFMLLVDVLPNVAGETPNVTISYVKEVGFVTNTTGGTTSAITVAAGGVPIGDVIVIYASHDNSNTVVAGGIQVTSVADNSNNAGAANVYTVQTHAIADPGAANAGIEGWFAVCPVTRSIDAADTITITYAISVAAKAISAQQFTNANLAAPVLSGSPAVQNNQTGQSVSVATGVAATRVGQAVCALVAVEGGTADAFTQDTDTTGGTWVALTRRGSGTTTGGATLNAVYKILTATGTQTYDHATMLGTSRDHCAAIFILDLRIDPMHYGREPSATRVPRIVPIMARRRR